MSKKSTKRQSSETRDTTKFCAFWGIVIAGAVMLVSFVFSLLAKLGVSISWLNSAISICNIISMVALLVAVGLPAHSYVRGKRKCWKVIFWIAFILYVLGIVGIGLVI